MPSPGFECEVIFVYTDVKPDRWPAAAALRHPEILELGGCCFVSGTVLTRGTTHWASGKRCLFALDKVTAIIEIESYDEYLKRESTITPPPPRDSTGG